MQCMVTQAWKAQWLWNWTRLRPLIGWNGLSWPTLCLELASVNSGFTLLWNVSSQHLSRFLTMKSREDMLFQVKAFDRATPSHHILSFLCQKGSLVFLEKQWKGTRYTGTPYAGMLLLFLIFYLRTILWFFVVQLQPKQQLFGRYYTASGQMINFVKTNVVFSKGVPVERRQQITLCLDIREDCHLTNIWGPPNLSAIPGKNHFSSPSTASRSNYLVL